MEITLKEEMFTNNEYTVSYGRREALFIIVDEEFPGNNRLARINRINVLVREFDGQGKEKDAALCTCVIGLGDGIVGIRSKDPALRGSLLTRENMEHCTVELVENE